ncbi:MAG: helicase, partial [Candidatus Poribacteria bacterium]|nr:helicase [Candidatus Poribacteria bacterium]
KLKEAAEAKIHAFITLLGADARLLTEGEDVESHELFNRLISRKTITGEDEDEESELKYLQVIRGIRDNAPDLFEKIKRLPKKARTAKKYGGEASQLLTYFRKGKLQKFYIVGKDQSEEVDLIRAAGQLEAQTKTPREKLPLDFYDKLGKNKQAFTFATTEKDVELEAHRGGSDSTMQVLKILRAVRDFRQYTEAQEAYLKRVMNRLEEGALPKQTTKTVLKVLGQELKTGQPNPLKVLAVLQNNVPDEFLESHVAESVAHVAGPREVILSEYLIGEAEQ